MSGTKNAVCSGLFAGLLSMSAMLVSGCGSDGPPEQTPERAPELTGTATYDESVQAGTVTGKGVAGPIRTAVNSTGTNQYAISVSLLTAPFALRWNGARADGQPVELYTVATQPGVANITPLTTLLVAQLMGQDPAAVYSGFSSGGVRTELITETNIQEAQTKLIAYLQNALGITVQPGSANFVTTPFNAVAGDPIFDTLQALNAKLAANGRTLQSLAVDIATAARLCLEEKILITVDGVQSEFCPASKSAEPEESDSTIFDYVFVNQAGDALSIKVRENSVLSAEFTSAMGAVYACVDAACSAIALGASREDLTRPIEFANAMLAGPAGNAMISGTLMGAIPGVPLPVLPCDDNRFFVILEDRSVVADCVDTFDPLGIGGTLNNVRGGVPSRAQYRFSNGASPTNARVELVTDANDSVLSVYFADSDPETFVTRRRFVCQGSECNGITLGPVTVNTDLGPDNPVLVRNVTMDDTLLSGINADGTPTNTSATLKASFTTVYYVDPFDPLEFPPLEDCPSGSDPISITVHSGSFNFCSNPADRGVFVQGDGTIELFMPDANYFTPISVLVRGGVVTQVDFDSNVNQRYRCMGNCTGVTISEPDEFGNRTLTFDGTVLNETQTFPLPGPRTAVLSGGPLVFPPPN